MTDRPASLIAGAGLLALAGMLSLIPFNSDDGPPKAVLYGGYVLGVLMLVAAYGVWQRRRWGMIAGLVAVIVNGLATVPGIFFAPSTRLKVMCAIGVLMAIAAVVALVSPASRRAYA